MEVVLVDDEGVLAMVLRRLSYGLEVQYYVDGLRYNVFIEPGEYTDVM